MGICKSAAAGGELAHGLSDSGRVEIEKCTDPREHGMSVRDGWLVQCNAAEGIGRSRRAPFGQTHCTGSGDHFVGICSDRAFKCGIACGVGKGGPAADGKLQS
eukprot:gnl/TRDRNA2_/TRDRNA2_127479_c0_seq1.p3 gnl/TRDRNA2_/TRDRNA2_127479_c0~~gnl/TRDRNA2_/TRDRNA2_127479_c0_seq1.p3  ORF type:complete len:103 (-),score=21.89 gnl/TRDRNA2_/TRDRNA2_127479_c0_seq1:144-452(-)